MALEISEYMEAIERQRAGLIAAVEGLPVEALDWAPLPRDTSSLSVLAHHCSGLLRLWMVEGLTGKDTGRSRESEFAAAGKDATALTDLINGAYDDAAATLASIDPAQLDQPAELAINHARRGEMHTRRFVILTPLTHVAEHIGHMQLTRQLWEARGS